MARAVGPSGEPEPASMAPPLCVCGQAFRRKDGTCPIDGCKHYRETRRGCGLLTWRWKRLSVPLRRLRSKTAPSEKSHCLKTPQGAGTAAAAEALEAATAAAAEAERRAASAEAALASARWALQQEQDFSERLKAERHNHYEMYKAEEEAIAA